MNGLRLVVLLALVATAGLTLVLAEMRWFRRVSLAERLRPHLAGGLASTATRRGLLSVASLRDVAAPLCREVGARAAALFGVREPLETRLRRVHAEIDPTTFRVRQITWSGLAALTGLFLGAAVRPPSAIWLAFVLGAPVLAFLAVEQRLANESDEWKRRLFLELPVVAEQLGMLLSAGYSLGAAVSRLADRGSGATGADLRRVVRRTRQGLSDVDALREWAVLAEVDALSRLVGVLALNREAGNLGRLIADEARSVRRDVQRELIETIERRNQQVWIPVTVAALVPGVMLMAVPFIDALSLFSGNP